ncbi:class II glutamine amidotransferase [Paracraurococcus ruber]|uniref:Class II glutamine amidotransferase n=1 Tax=Paracraurococcus ruber TaxID=77675 RepID=A0ABS1CYG5_9PROT|nr:class II glutamine amidotransferase [Paracraurococcus ruber]MBK1659356.1 class II glutamine amidotransferase [Paracraurococcus ruber]TDG33567.1 class II glutamine amidotransferase [Paracraurococcus ruber]
MCELLGMSANVPTDIAFSFAGLMRRGGQTGPHADGWGITFYEDKGCRAFHDPRPAARSDVAEFVRSHPIKSNIVLCHIRRANRGRVALENTHPFQRELWGRPWSFAHNGQLRGVKRWPLGAHAPIGTTDSEHAFCWLMDALRARFARPPSDRDLAAAVQDLAGQLAGLGVFNMLLSDGRSLFCHCSNRLAWLTRRAPFGPATLVDEDLTVDFARETTPGDVVTVVATRPLTRDEAWTVMEPGSCVVFRQGEAVPLPARRAPRRVAAVRGMAA